MQAVGRDDPANENNQPRHHARDTRAEVKGSLSPRVAAHLPFAVSEALGARDGSMLAAFAAKHLLSLSGVYARPLALAPARSPDSILRGSLGEIRRRPAPRQ